LEPEDIQLLTQIGYLAAARADVQRAERIFGALALVRPNKAFVHLGVPVALLNAGRTEAAALRLESVQLAPSEDADMVHAFLGLAQQLNGQALQAMRTLRPLADSARKDNASEGAHLAARLLGEPPP
jgi:Flp pilus assembly protein TadD